MLAWARKPGFTRDITAVRARWLTGLGLGVALGMLALGAAVLTDSRRDTWQQAERWSDNLIITLERDIARNVAVYDLSLQGVIEALGEPGIEAVSPTIKRAAMFDRSASAEYLGSLLVLDAQGDIVADSTSTAPHHINFQDRDYFEVHRATPDAGLFVSRPFKSRLRGGDASIAISRRLPRQDGAFGGVVVGTLRLAYFKELFGKLDLGPNGTVTLVRADGQVLVRQAAGEGLSQNVSKSPVFEHFAEAPTGSFVGVSALDGVKRHLTYRKVGDLPMVLVVGLSFDDIYATWWQKAIRIGSIMVGLCGATVVLCLLFRRELLRRIAAERALRVSGERLKVLAATDGLTGLVNRGAFEIELVQEWKRAVRGRTPLAILLLDADWFKLYNDRYGHQGGDDVLRKVAAAIQASIRRPGDVGARYGGEEFVMLLPETDEAGALNTAERVCAAISELAIPHDASPLGRVTVSLGWAVAHPQPGQAEGMLVKRADQALYEAKRRGRARICAATAEATEMDAPALPMLRSALRPV